LRAHEPDRDGSTSTRTPLSADDVGQGSRGFPARRLIYSGPDFLEKKQVTYVPSPWTRIHHLRTGPLLPSERHETPLRRPRVRATRLMSAWRIEYDDGDEIALLQCVPRRPGRSSEAGAAWRARQRRQFALRRGPYCSAEFAGRRVVKFGARRWGHGWIIAPDREATR